MDRPAPPTPPEPAAGRAKLPSYDPLQSSFHLTFRDELYRAIDALKMPAGAHVLDAPCGNGFYSRRLVDRVAPAGKVTLVDTNTAYLDQARHAVADPPDGVTVDLRQANVYELPFPDGTFDLVWCAQSLISLKDGVRALREFARVTKPGGRVAVLEADEYHHILLPWPVELELAIQAALARAARDRYGSGSRLAPARHVRRMLADAGWKRSAKRTFTCDRQAPFKPWEAEFLARHLEYVGDLVRDSLSADDRARFDRLTDPASPASFLARPDAELTCLNTLHVARKAG